MTDNTADVIIVGAGIGGLTLALTLHRAGIACRIYEATAEMRPIGVGINILPHATRELAALGLEAALADGAVTTAESCFYNRFGQLIYKEPLGRYAGNSWPQFSIHRGDLQAVLLDGWHCLAVEQDDTGATAHFHNPANEERLPPQRGAIVVACDGIHSAIRRQLYPAEG